MLPHEGQPFTSEPVVRPMGFCLEPELAEACFNQILNQTVLFQAFSLKFAGVDTYPLRLFSLLVF